MTIKDVLIKSGFREESKDEKFVRDLGGGFTVEAYINGNEGTIFHLVKVGVLMNVTIQTIDYADIAEAFNQLLPCLKSIVENMN